MSKWMTGGACNCIADQWGNRREFLARILIPKSGSLNVLLDPKSELSLSCAPTRSLIYCSRPLCEIIYLLVAEQIVCFDWDRAETAPINSSTSFQGRQDRDHVHHHPQLSLLLWRQFQGNDNETSRELIHLLSLMDVWPLYLITILCPLSILAGRWCRREWTSPAQDTRNADPQRGRGILYQSVFLGSPGKSFKRI